MKYPVEKLESRRLLATFTVTSTADAGAGSLREAIGLANASVGADEIVFDLGGDATVLLSSGSIDVTDGLMIAGPGNAEVTIDAQQTSSIFRASATAGTFEVRDLSLSNGSAVSAGGAVSAENDTNLTLTRVRLLNNTAGGNGGAVAAAGQTIVISDCYFEGNTAAGSGGAVATGSAQFDTLSVSGSEFIGNTSISGGAILAQRPSMISASRFQDNVARRGGALTLTAPVDPDNQIPNEIKDSEFAGNRAELSGGAIEAYFASTLIFSSRFIDNQVASTGQTQIFGGAITASLMRRFEVHNSEFTGNTAAADVDDAPDLATGGAMSLHLIEAGLLLVNNTLTGNQAARGGAIRISDTPLAALSHNTITQNTSPATAAVDILASFNSVRIELAGNIIAGNASASGPEDYFESVADGANVTTEHAFFGVNLLGSQFASDPAATGQLIADDPELLPLNFYGGDSRIMPPAPATGLDAGSPAYNGGDQAFAVSAGLDGAIGTADDVPLTTDQRGFPRVAYGQVDLGAAEFVLQGDANLDGTVDLSDFVILRNNFGSGSLFSQGDFNGDGQVDLADFVILRNNFGETIDDD